MTEVSKIRSNNTINNYFSSQTLNTPKVNQLIRLSGERLELKITIVTWAPEVYRYGRDEVRIELINRLRAAAFWKNRPASRTCTAK